MEQIYTTTDAKEIALAAVYVGLNFADELRHRSYGHLGSVDIWNTLGVWTIDFYDQHKHVTEWEAFCRENKVHCWDDYLFHYITAKIDAVYPRR